MIKITQRNDFRLTIAPYAVSGNERTPVSLNGIEGIRVTIPHAVGSYLANVDSEGRLVLEIDGPNLCIGKYSMSVSGTLNGDDYCFTIKDLFQVVEWTADSNVYTEDNISVDIPVPPYGGGDTLLLARVIDIEDYDTLERKEENVLYVVTNEREN